MNNGVSLILQYSKSMKEIVAFSFVISLVGGKFYLIALEKNQTDNIPLNSYDTGNDEDFDVLAYENHDYQDCPMPFNPCHSGITCLLDGMSIVHSFPRDDSLGLCVRAVCA